MDTGLMYIDTVDTGIIDMFSHSQDLELHCVVRGVHLTGVNTRAPQTIIFVKRLNYYPDYILNDYNRLIEFP